MTTLDETPYSDALRKLAHDLRVALEAQQQDEEANEKGQG